MIESSKLPKPETWDKVAEDYNINIDDSEKELAYEIITILNSVDVKKGAKLLELGSGSGHLSAILAMEGYNVTLLDFSEKALEKSQETFRKYNLDGNFINGDLMNLPQLSEEYDLVWNSGVMEHFDEQQLKAISKGINQRYKCGFLCIVPNPQSLPYLIYRYKLILNGLWNVGKEYLRTNYEKMFNSNGFKVMNKYYLGELFSRKHMEIAFDLSTNVSYFHELCKNELLPESEKYLVAYFCVSSNEIDDSCKNELIDNTDYKSGIFDLTANFTAIRNDYMKEINLLKGKLESYDNIISNNNMQKDSIINEQNNIISLLKDELGNYDNIISEQNNNISLLKDEKIILLNEVDEFKNDIEIKITEIIRLKDKVQYQEELKDEVFKLNEKINQNIIEINNKNGQINYFNNEILAWEKAKMSTIDKLKEISMLKPYRVSHSIRRFKHQYKNGSQQEKKQFKSWLKNKLLRKPVEECHRYDPLFEAINILNNSHSYVTDSFTGNEVSMDDNNVINTNLESEFVKEYTLRYDYYEKSKNEEFHDETKEIIDLIESKKYKGIVVYPEAVMWEPVQRPQHILRELSERGFLCFFCEPSNDSFKIEKKEENLYLINNSKYLLQALKPKSVIVLCSWLLQMAWADNIENKVLWYDVLDQLDFLSLYDDNYLDKHNEILREAQFVSYSANLLKKYVAGRKDVYYLPNAVNINDFLIEKNKEAELIKTIKEKNNKIIGYYGAIEAWFDKNIILELAKKHKDWEFVIIGSIGINVKDVDLENVHFIGKVLYKELRKFADYFDVAVIPFEINDITNCVSPVKFFEYAAMGKPVVTTAIEEMKQYECEWVKVANNINEFENSIIEVLNCDVGNIAKRKGLDLAKLNLWEDRVNVFLNYLSNDIEGWKIYSNLNLKNSVCAYAETFLDFEGDNFYSGGAERYLIDLAEICKENKISFNICQYGNYKWVRKFKNINIISLASKEVNAGSLTVEAVNSFNREFYQLVNYRTNLSVYSPFFISTPYTASPNVGISHGVCWDHKFNKFNNGYDLWNDKKRFIDGASKLEKIVSVDTNTANWFQTINFEMSKNIKVIPNYVDLNEFKFIEKSTSDEKIVITYPRRLYEARGLYLVLNILDEVLIEYPQVEFHFIGRGFEEDTRHVQEKVDKWNGRVKWYSLLPEEMPKVYEISDITLIPTLYSEGTSLSCLEAMATGNVIIATRVGGLTDLIIDGFNGCLIGLHENELLESLKMLIDDKRLREEFSFNSIKMAKAFSKEKWDQKWRKFLVEYMDKTMETREREKHVKIYLSSYKSINNQMVKNKIVELLNDGHFVEIRINDSNLCENMSFGRIQFAKWNVESLYASPDLIIADKEAAKKLECKIDVLLE